MRHNLKYLAFSACGSAISLVLIRHLKNASQISIRISRSKECDHKDKATLYCSIAGHHKDRLHSVQAAEWQVYYAIWAVLLASLYFQIVSVHGLLIEAAEEIGRRGLTDEYAIRNSRLLGCLILASIFYIPVWLYYFRSFYRKNYETIDLQRSLFEFYLDRANKESNGTDTSNSNHIYIGKHYTESRIYRGRLFILTIFMIFCFIVNMLCSYLAPVKEHKLAFSDIDSLSSRPITLLCDLHLPQKIHGLQISLWSTPAVIVKITT